MFDLQPVSDDSVRVRWHGDLTPQQPASKAENLFLAVERKRPAHGTWKRVLMDLNQATTIDSRGIAMMLLLRRNLVRRDIELSIEGAPASMSKMLQLANLDRAIPLEERGAATSSLITAADLDPEEISFSNATGNTDSFGESQQDLLKEPEVLESALRQPLREQDAVVIDPFEDAKEDLSENGSQSVAGEHADGGTAFPAVSVFQESRPETDSNKQSDQNMEANNAGESR